MWVLIVITIGLFVLARRAQHDDRAILYCLLVSVSYYCLGGGCYWAFARDGVFLGADWGPNIVLRSAAIVAVCTLAWASFIVVFSRLSEMQWRSRYDPLVGDAVTMMLSQKPSRTFWFLLIASLTISFFVMRVSSFAGQDEFSRDAGGPFFLIAFQFADMMIPLILYLVATRGYTRLVVLLIVLFSGYAVLTGLRSKLALLFLPILWDLVNSKISIVYKLGAVIVLGVGGLFLFAIMTFYRVKFGIPDFSVPLSDPGAQILYGFFVDANILFGQTAIIQSYANQGLEFPLVPITDSFTQFLPHFLFPDRTGMTYSHSIYYFGLGTEAATRSGMAWPWIGEFMMMFGWFAVVLGPVIMLLVYVFWKSWMIVSCATRRQYAIGMALVAAVVGYFQFSRGALSFDVKAYIFVILPYVYLCGRDVKRIVVRTDPSRPIHSDCSIDG